MHTEARLRRLADLVGILPGYVDSTGKKADNLRRHASSAPQALGFDASTETLADSALAKGYAVPERERLVALRTGHARLSAAGFEWNSAFHCGSRGCRMAGDHSGREPGHDQGVGCRGGRPPHAGVTVPLRQALPLGYYTLDVTVRRGEATRRSVQSLIVAPDAAA